MVWRPASGCETGLGELYGCLSPVCVLAYVRLSVALAYSRLDSRYLLRLAAAFAGRLSGLRLASLVVDCIPSFES